MTEIEKKEMTQEISDALARKLQENCSMQRRNLSLHMEKRFGLRMWPSYLERQLDGSKRGSLTGGYLSE